MFREGTRLRAEHGDDAVADLSLGQPLEPDDSVAAAFRAAAAERFPGRHEYMPNLGYDDVRSRVAERCGVPGVHAEHVAMTQGAAAAVCVALRTFVDPGQDVVGVAPYFPEFRLYAETASARFVPVPVRDDMSLDLESIAAALSRNTGAVVVNSPNNPSGHVLRRDELEGLATLLRQHNAHTGSRVLLIVDEVYRRLLYPPHRYASPFESYEHAVLARSFSKDLGIAGERIGYLVIHPSLASDAVRLGLELSMRALGFVNAPATAQRALLHLAGWSVDISLYRSRRDLIVELARDAGLEFADPQGGLYLWMRSPWEDTLALVDHMVSQRVLVIPGVAFGMLSHVRLCFSYPEPKLAMAVNALAAARTAVPVAHNREPRPVG